MTARLTEQYNEVMDFMRTGNADVIDVGYEFFFEEDDPDEYMGGRALELAFVNFEDWFVCDYIPPRSKHVIDLYREALKPEGEAALLLGAMKDSCISLYKVISVDGGLRLKDMLLDEEVAFPSNPVEGIEPGMVFGARIIRVDGTAYLGRCVYPFTETVMDRVMKSIDATRRRYLKNKNPEGSVRDFLRDESYMMNMVWITNLHIIKK
jgi:hypothetical protein